MFYLQLRIPVFKLSERQRLTFYWKYQSCSSTGKACIFGQNQEQLLVWVWVWVWKVKKDLDLFELLLQWGMCWSDQCNPNSCVKGHQFAEVKGKEKHFQTENV